MDLWSRPVTWAVGGLIVLTAIRLWVAATAPLAPDEAYYWIWSQALASGYVDHPPMVALWIKAGTSLVGATAVGVRLLGPISAAVGSWLLYDAAERLFPGRSAGLTAAALSNATLIVGTGSVIMTPDTPLLLFWTATLWTGARLAAGGAPAWWLAAGVFTGLALVSKYTAALLSIGLGLFALLAAPRALRRPEPWLGLLIAGLLFVPVVVWNEQHGWIGFLRQGGRVADWQPARAAGFLAELLGGQIGMATPGVFVLLTAGIVTAVRMTAQTRRAAWSLLTAFSVPPILVFVQHAVGDRVQGNWPAIVYPAAAVAAGGLTSSAWRRWTLPSCALGLAIVAALYAHAISGWPVSSHVRDTVATQLFGWDRFAADVDAARREAGASFIAAEPYGLAAQLVWALPRDVAVFGVGSHWASIRLARTSPGDAQGILIRPQRYGAPDAAEWRDAVQLPAIVRGPGIETYVVYRVRATNARTTEALLPHR